MTKCITRCSMHVRRLDQSILHIKKLPITCVNFEVLGGTVSQRAFPVQLWG